MRKVKDVYNTTLLTTFLIYGAALEKKTKTRAR